MIGTRFVNLSMIAYLGIDVQLKRPPAWMALDSSLAMIESGWLEGNDIETISAAALKVVKQLQSLGYPGIHIGIDSPRCPLLAPREWYWQGQKQSWRKRRASDKGKGRHCEVVVSAAGLANPQWTPSLEDSPDWMRLGYALFETLEAQASGATAVHEVFPSASYAMWYDDPDAPRVTLDVSQFLPGPKDMIDAAVAAMTVREYEQGRGAAVGRDGLGCIVLPKPISHVPAALLHWPG